MASPKKTSAGAKAAKHAKKATAHAKQAEKHANASKKHAKLANKAANDAKKAEKFPARVTTKKDNLWYGPAAFPSRVGGKGLFSSRGVVPAIPAKKSTSSSPSPNMPYGYRATGGMGLFTKNGPVPVFPKKKKSRKAKR